MPYDDGSRSLMDDLKACIDARKASYAYGTKAIHNRHLEACYKRAGSTNAEVYTGRACMFEQQEVALLYAADHCSKQAYESLVTGDIEYDEVFYNNGTLSIRRA